MAAPAPEPAFGDSDGARRPVGDMPESESAHAAPGRPPEAAPRSVQFELQGLNHDGPGRGSHGHAARSLRVRSLAAVPLSHGPAVP